jgi:hypothetical protein
MVADLNVACSLSDVGGHAERTKMLNRDERMRECKERVGIENHHLKQSEK